MNYKDFKIEITESKTGKFKATAHYKKNKSINMAYAKTKNLWILKNRKKPISTKYYDERNAAVNNIKDKIDSLK